jgi:hypothetical protein
MAGAPNFQSLDGATWVGITAAMRSGGRSSLRSTSRRLRWKEEEWTDWCVEKIVREV